MLPFFPSFPNPNHGGRPNDSLQQQQQQAMLLNPTMFPNPRPMSNFNRNNNNNGGWPPPSPMMMMPSTKAPIMLQNNHMGLLPQLGQPLFSPNPAAAAVAAQNLNQHLVALQLQQNLNALASFQSTNMPGNFNAVGFGMMNGGANLQNLMMQGNQIGGGLGVPPCARTNNSGLVGTHNVAFGDSDLSFGKGKLPAKVKQNKFNPRTNYKKFQPPNSRSSMNKFQDLKHNKTAHQSQNHRFQNSQHAKHARRNSRPSAGTGGKGQNYRKDGSQFENCKPALSGCKRSHFYTESEIRQWVAARKKNYPTGANIEKKLSKSVSSSKDADIEAKLRRQQMKEVLAKQAELGVEVAEVPPSYLTENQASLSNRNKRSRHGRERSNLRTEASNVSVLSTEQREPTLLQKLLNAEIRGDKNRILQVFRFMALNSFFDNGPDKPLEYPIVSIKDIGPVDDAETSETQDVKNIDKAWVRKNDGLKDSHALEVENSGEDDGNTVTNVAHDCPYNGGDDRMKDRLEESEEGEITE